MANILLEQAFKALDDIQDEVEVTVENLKEEVGVDLPSEITINFEDFLPYGYEDMMISEEEYTEMLSDYLSDTYGYCHFGFDWEYGEEVGTVNVYNIKWDTTESLDKYITESDDLHDVEYEEIEFFAGDEGDLDAEDYVKENNLDDYEIEWDDYRKGYVLYAPVTSDLKPEDRIKHLKDLYDIEPGDLTSAEIKELKDAGALDEAKELDLETSIKNADDEVLDDVFGKDTSERKLAGAIKDCKDCEEEHHVCEKCDKEPCECFKEEITSKHHKENNGEYDSFDLGYIDRVKYGATHYLNWLGKEDFYQVKSYRPYDDAEYHYAHSEDGKNWKIILDKTVKDNIKTDFEDFVTVAKKLGELDIASKIEPRIVKDSLDIKKSESSLNEGQNTTTTISVLDDGEKVIKQVGYSGLCKKLVNGKPVYRVKYAPGYYVNDVEAKNDAEAIRRFLGLNEAVDNELEYYVVSYGNPYKARVFTKNSRQVALDTAKSLNSVENPEGNWTVYHYTKPVGGDLDYEIIKEECENCNDELTIKYWVDEEARDQGLSDIYFGEVKDLADAKRIADKLFSEYASVEVVKNADTEDEEVLYGRYPEDESLEEGLSKDEKAVSEEHKEEHTVCAKCGSEEVKYNDPETKECLCADCFEKEVAKQKEEEKKSLEESITVNINDEEEIKDAKKELEKSEKKADEFEQIVDVDADAIEDLKDSYVGNVILVCDSCLTPKFIKPELLKKDEETGLYNIGDACPHCGSEKGYKVEGQVATADVNVDVEKNETTGAPDSEPVEKTDIEIKSEEESEEKPLPSAMESTQEPSRLEKVDLNEQRFDRLVNKFVHTTYENVESYKTNNLYLDDDNSLIVEGVLKYKSGKEKEATFKLVEKKLTTTKEDVIALTGICEAFNTTEKAFTFRGNLSENMLNLNSLTFNFNTKVLNESKNIKGKVCIKY